MPHLILVKHSLPTIDPGVAADAWQLSAAGRARCAALAAAVAAHRPEVIVTSAEPKAAETASLLAGHLGLGYTVAPNLHEHERRTTPWLTTADFTAQVAHFFAEPASLVMGEETADQAHRRFAAAVDEQVATHSGRTLAIVAHGTVISLYVARATGIAPFPLWQQLDLPSFLVLALPEWRLVCSHFSCRT